MKTLVRFKLIPLLACVLAGNVHAQLQTAGPVLVSIDAISLPLGSLTSITNHGTMGGYFEARGGGATVPLIAPVDGGGTTGLRFDGEDYLQHVATLGGALMPAPAGLVGVNPTCTVEAWVLNGAIDQEETIVAWGNRKSDSFDPDGSNFSFNYGWSAGYGAMGHWGTADLGWTTGVNGNDTFGSAVPAAGVWHHLVYTFDGTTQRVYADGVLKNSENISSTPIDIYSANSITLASQLENDFGSGGGMVTTTRRGSLTMGRLRIHDGALTAAQVTTNYNLERSAFTNGPGSLLASGPIHRYPFDFPAGPAPAGYSVLDAVGTAHGAVGGSGGVFTGSRLTLPGGASSSAAYAALPSGLLSAHSTNNGGTGEFTIEGWVKITGNRNWSRIFDFGSINGPNGEDFLMYSAQFAGNVYARQCRVWNSGAGGAVGGTGGGGDSSHGTTTFNQNVHFAITWDDYTGEITIYENGAVVTRRTETARIGQINDPYINLGRSNYSGDQNTQGEYDEIRIYNRVLVEGELRGNFLRGPNAISVAPLSILFQPRSQTVEIRSNVTFSVTAAGTPPLAYQWRLNGTDIAGATATNYVIPDVLLSQAGNYTVVVTNGSGSITSVVAVLTVTIRELTWDGGGDPNPNFSTAANWLADDAPPRAATLHFDGTVNLTPFNDLPTLAGPSNSVIHFSPTAGAFTLGGSAIQGGDVTNSSAVAQTINLQMRLDGYRTIDTGSGGIILGVPGVLIGSALGAWTKTGPSALTLRGNATGSNVNYLINAGSMIFETASGETTRLSSAAIELSSGTQLRFNNAGRVEMASVTARAGSQIILGNTGTVTNTTVTVQAGASLSGSGVLHGNVGISGTISPGTSIGTMHFNHGALQGTAVMELNRTNAQNCDRITAFNSIALGGVLLVTNLGELLAAGDTFDLLDAPIFLGGFLASNLTLPSLAPGLEWDLGRLNGDGIIRVQTTAPPGPTNYVRLKSFGFPDLSGLNGVGVMEGSDGALYGTTQTGGTSNFGTIFRINKDGSGHTGLRSFTGRPDGGLPLASLLEGSDGMLYGTTFSGGISNLGTVFRLNKDGSGHTILKHFAGADGQNPHGAALTEGSDGALYGTTPAGGGAGFLGTIFRMNKDGSGFAVLRNFASPGSDGSQPTGRLDEGTDGALYGITTLGGSGFGTVYKINKDGSGYTQLRLFSNASTDGRAPNRLFEGSDGVLYGSVVGGTNTSGGSIFKMNKDGTGYGLIRSSTLLYVHVEGSDGLLYGANGVTLFKMNKDGSGYTNIFAATVTTALSAIQGSDGAIYATTSAALFKSNTNGTTTTTNLTFGVKAPDGRTPRSPLIVGSDGWLYGSSYGVARSTNIASTVFKLQTDGSSFSVLHTFTNLSAGDGLNPLTLIEDTNGVLFGVTDFGGVSNRGTIFAMNRDGSSYAVLQSLPSANSSGAGPSGLLAGSDGLLYGVTLRGGTVNQGSIYSLNKDGSGFTVLRSMTGVAGDGRSPGSLIEASDGLLYWVATSGAAGGATVFKMNKDGSNFAPVPSTAGTPTPSSLFEGTDGVLYGTSITGGTAGGGILFKLNKDGSGFAALHNFTISDPVGYTPISLREGTDGALYGITQSGTVSGTAFRVNKDGSGFVNLHLFSQALGDGYLPVAGLIQGSDGALYGTTTLGGDLNLGTLFKLFSTPSSPMITAQPQSRTNAVGSAATFSVSALGAQPLSYQWQFNEADIASATGADHTIASVQLSHAGNYRVIVTNSAGSVTSAVATLTVTVTVPPLAIAPATTNVGNGAVVTFTATGGTPPYTYSPVTLNSGGSITAGGDYTAGVLCGTDTVRVTDSLGATAQSVVTVLDILPPVVMTCATNRTLAADANCQATLPNLSGEISASDACGAVTVTQSPLPGTLLALGAHLVTFTIADAASNTTNCTALITVADTMPPTIACSPNITVDAATPAGAIVVFSVTATDVCSPNPVVSCVPASGSQFPLGATLVNCTAVDSAGNSNSCVFTVTVTPPPALGISPATTNVLAGASLTFTASGGFAPYQFAFATNDSGGTLTNGTYTAGLLSGTDAVLVTDAAGSNALAFVTVTANTAPTVSNAIPAQAGAYGAAFQFTFAADVFTDPDAGQSLIYAAANQPPGVGFDAATRTFSGTNGAAGVFAVSVIATDDGVPPRSATNIFDLTVAKAPLTVTANAASRPYGEANPLLTGSLTGLVNLDNITATFDTVTTLASAPGTYPIAPALADPDHRLGHYTVTTNLGTLTIQEVRLESSLAGTTATLYWSTGAVNLLLECTTSLEAPINWQPVTSGITITATNISYTVLPVTVPPSRFYRLRLP